MYAITGASGRLGRLVLDALLEKIAPSQIVALTRDTTRLAELAKQGVIVRPFDYNKPETLLPGLYGVERLLLISGDTIGQRERQHRAVIRAAKNAGVTFIAYTSVLHAHTCTINLAAEHRASEAAVKESGLNYALLRHGWYTENTTMNAASDIARGTVMGSAGSGRQSTATRADFAAGDAAVLLDLAVVNRTFELAGDNGYTINEYAAVLAEIGGKPVSYIDLPEADYRDALERAGLPRRFALLLAESSAKSAQSIMFDNGGELSRLIGRPTTPLRASVAQAVGSSGLRAEDNHVFNNPDR